MKKNEKRPGKYIPGRDEIIEETNQEIKPEEKPNSTPGAVDYPEVEDDLNVSEFERNVAQQIGLHSDQVMLGSPAAEAGTIGQDNLKATIEASKKKLAQKMKDNDKE